MKKTKLILSCLLVAASMYAQKNKNIKRPNIIYILADDMGPGDVSAYNKEGKIMTPNIDRLAVEGVKFMDAHTNSSVCTPTRYGILTGRYAWRTNKKEGVLGGMSKHLINPSRETVASFLQKQGYKTACFGKWHLGMDWQPNKNYKGGKKDLKFDVSKAVKNGPNAVGFDKFYGIAGSLNMAPHGIIIDDKIQGDMEFVKSRSEMDARGYKQPANAGWVSKGFKQDELLGLLAQETTKWIKDNKDNPFFVYMPLHSPHSPIVPSSDFVNKSQLNNHGDYCLETDYTIGKVLNMLDELNIADNTMVIFTADNGTSPKAQLGEMQAKGHYTSWIYRGLKGTLWEGGHRMPFLVRWPQVAKANTVSNKPICTTDFFATCAEVTGVDLKDNEAEDSFSFLSALKGNDKRDKDRIITHHSDKGVFAVRQGKWKLMMDHKGGSPRANPKDKLQPVKNIDTVLLFDMEKDAIESTNLSKEHPEIVIHLKKELARIIKRGRSNEGKNQPTDLNDPNLKWPQINMLQEYLN
ncbi:sulfatase family protein [Wenyingzhuangia aestuarii]|uniref:sulfatase family protein n=1 Tax=Wenyingzhuangia aestuarii TaxID=1647582 RepID=UPI001438A103|nr:arylsulfatase [Wenyingzhuangia aestuarii]NJB83670.1 arylsulfatase A-like enzyme [Wenyingzhuangia aestuarii]